MNNKLIKLTTSFTKSASEEGDLIIDGYANTTTVDRMGDVIAPEAWTGKGLDNYKKNPIILAFHNYAMPIGRATDLSTSDSGLHISATISKAAGSIYDLIKEGVVSTFSVGFMVKDATYDSNTDIFVIKDLELLEISVVSVPANADSTFSVRKQLGEEYNNMKKEFTNIESDKQSTENSTDAPEDNLITQEVAKKLDVIVDLLAKQVGEKQVVDTTVIKSDAEKLQEEIDRRVSAAIESRDKAAKESAEKEKEVQKSIELEKIIGDLKAEITDKAAELEAVRKSKMSFSDSNSGFGTISTLEKDTAIMLSTILKKDIKDTKYGRQLLEKGAASTGNDHIPSDLWESEFSIRAFDDLRQRLVLAPLFNTVQMNALNLVIPVNPDPSANATWVQRAALGTSTSSGAAVTTALSEVTMKAYKLATHEYLIDEEEEDSILAVAAIIRDAMLRRMGRTWDKALLRGAANGTTDPIEGIATVADTANLEVAMDGALATDKVTVDDLSAIRRKLGIWGLDPMDVIYIVSTEAYFDLLEDPDFRTMDLVGINATILRGQIGSVNGSPVIVSGEFAAKGASVINSVALNKTAFMMGQQRALRMERDREVLEQRELLSASTRVGFVNLISGKGAAVLKYPAA